MLRRVLLAIAFAFAVSPAFAGNVLVTVDLEDQSMQVRVDGIKMYEWDVSTGRSGYTTPSGRYQPIRMHKKYFSKKYDNAPMPYAIFFYGGYAIHGTTDLKRLGRIASHGCVRLDPANAKLLFALVQEHGMPNTVIRVGQHAALLAEIDTMQALVAKPREVTAVGAAAAAPAIDASTTGSIATAPVAVAWLRQGLGH